jgi:uncharacterized protein YprB with RNaseH-like and TPR domain
MIRNTFSLLKGIGEGLERKLWRKGILEWGDFLDTPRIGFISDERKKLFDDALVSAKNRLSEGDLGYFAELLKPREHWRLYEEFKGEAVCLDIETNGYPPWSGGYVTVVGLYDGYDYKAFVRGKNLSAEDLEKELSGYRYLITFFGSGFDMPFLKETLGVTFRGAHFDLCFGARKAGLKGGLKRIEEEMGIERDESVKGLDGYDAVKLWREARYGNQDAQDLLITYNRSDTVNLYPLSGIIYKKLRATSGIEEYLN